MLRSGSLGGSDVVRETMPWLPVAGRDLFATFAYTALTPHGTVGMRHVLNGHLDGVDGFTEVVTTALASVQDGLILEEAVTGTGRLIRMHRPDGFGAAGQQAPELPLAADRHRDGDRAGRRRRGVLTRGPGVPWFDLPRRPS
ncbi:hypothetical protein GCM10017786_12020 [Amycolatopsis deserti]|uniref:Uncharacterized protein n=1 Tax=Amycolatopsis deserti TaxID=185696 RepID=A0ABQ3IFJ9_9PSEU|nr:hypothetical protein [Amycolatopsis deserti]GHE82704.1 hypothetical protein GCM10017786_12020 [Amycolatopsis deserti]